MRYSSALLVIALLSGGCLVRQRPVDPNEPLPAYEAPKPLAMEVPDGAKVGFVQAMYQGNEWITPPPQVGETIAMVNPKVSKLGDSHLPAGIAEFGMLRVLELKEYSRVRTGRSVVVTFQVVYVPERIPVLPTLMASLDWGPVEEAGQPEGSRRAHEAPARTEDPAPSTGTVSIQVQVYDDTKKVPLPGRAEIWFRGLGSWWITREMNHGSDFGLTHRIVSDQPIGRKDTFYIYPDGRSGREIGVAYEVTSDMNPNPGNAIIINLSDSEVEVIGRALETATGRRSFKVSRR